MPLVFASMREIVPSPAFAAQTAPAPTATPFGNAPTEWPSPPSSCVGRSGTPSRRSGWRPRRHLARRRLRSGPCQRRSWLLPSRSLDLRGGRRCPGSRQHKPRPRRGRWRSAVPGVLSVCQPSRGRALIDDHPHDRRRSRETGPRRFPARRQAAAHLCPASPAPEAGGRETSSMFRDDPCS
jgi:hypothetical protein